MNPTARTVKTFFISKVFILLFTTNNVHSMTCSKLLQTSQTHKTITLHPPTDKLKDYLSSGDLIHGTSSQILSYTAKEGVIKGEAAARYSYAVAAHEHLQSNPETKLVYAFTVANHPSSHSDFDLFSHQLLNARLYAQSSAEKHSFYEALSLHSSTNLDFHHFF